MQIYLKEEYDKTNAAKNTELELTDEMLYRNDEIDRAVYDCVNILVEKEIDWDMQIINECTDAIKAVLSKYKLKVRHPGIKTNADGTQEYEE